MALKPVMLSTDDVESSEENPNVAITKIETDDADLAPIETDSDYGDLVAADEKSITVSDDISNETDADTALEAIANYLDKSLSSCTYDKYTLNMANVAIESICERVNFKNDRVVFSMENYKKDPKKAIELALEDIREKASALWASVKNKMTELARYLGEKMNFYRRNMINLKRRIVELERKLTDTPKDAEPKAKILKPQGWFLDLMYTDKPMSKGLSGVGSAVEELLNEHRQMATSSVNKYAKWLLDNYKSAETDSTTFKTLKVSKNEFLILNSTEFNRSIGLKRPASDCMFYRSKELPGNRALFTEAKESDKNGVAAIGSLASIGFSMNTYDPDSFRLRMLAIKRIALLSTPVWLLSTGVVIGIGASTVATAGIAAGAMGTSLYAIYKSAKVKDTGIRVHIDKNMIFHTLTIDEARKVISDARNGYDALQLWYKDIFEHNWKQTDLDRIINDVTGISKVEVRNNSSFRALKRYCVGLLNLMNATTVGTHVYAFKTYDAMLNYVDKSLRQY